MSRLDAWDSRATAARSTLWESSPRQEPPLAELAFHVPSMTCRHCARTVSAVVRDVPGVRTVAVDPRSATITVTGNVSPEGVRDALHSAGYDADT